MDFLKIAYNPGTKYVNGPRKGESKEPPSISPKFIVTVSKDLMIRGNSFYAMWDEDRQCWTKDFIDVVTKIDRELVEYKKDHGLEGATVKYMWDSDSGSVDKWNRYTQRQLPDNFHNLDESLVFANTPKSRELYSTKTLPYSLIKTETPAWDELIGTLYSEEERHKIEWGIGSVVSGESKELQKFFVFYGSAGTGKSTVLNIIQELFEGYYTVFDARALGTKSDAFALEPFKDNPLVAIQHDGDLSRIEDNTRLNSLASHEEMTINEKFKSQYKMRINALMFMGTNRPVKITDSKSGIIRRLIDITPSENLIPRDRYYELMDAIKFELGGIAYHCKEVYEADRNYYDKYIPLSMIGATNDLFNFMEEMFEEYLVANEVTLNEAWLRYKKYCEEAAVQYPLIKRTFKEELKTYFSEFKERDRNKDGAQIWNSYRGLRVSRFGYDPNDPRILELQGSESIPDRSTIDEISERKNSWLDFFVTQSMLDKELAKMPAQYATKNGTPKKPWDDVTTKLEDLNTGEVHYVRVPENLIVIDFDIKDENGNKSFEKNFEAASKWPKTYAELSKSGAGIHLHYFYTGDVSLLSAVYEEDIEVKVFTGKSSLRRKLTKCNDIPIAQISSGLPLRKEKPVLSGDIITNEKALRTIIQRALKKEYGERKTITNISYVHDVLEKAYNAGAHYDVSVYRPLLDAFANNSTNSALRAIKLVDDMKFKSEDKEGVTVERPPVSEKEYASDKLVFFDVEVFPNLLIVCYKPEGAKGSRLFNPKPYEIEKLCKYKLVGFNNRRYDNHILYARMMGMSNEELYQLSKLIVNGGKNCFFREAYNLSYTDVYDFSSAANKQGLKKWEIQLGIFHLENEYDWDQPLPEEHWDEVADYCMNDVIATEATFNHLRDTDWVAREGLAAISGLTVNDTTNAHTTKIIVGDTKNPQQYFVYTDLSKEFPGYEFDKMGIDKSRYNEGTKIVSGKSIYRGEDPGEGGYVYANPGMYRNVALLDIASMHPHSLIALNLFGDEFTASFKELVDARIAIKHEDYEAASKMLGGKLAPFLTNKEDAKKIADALKTAINSVYGLTSAKFDNKLRDPRNIDNIVAKRGALFMINLKHEVEDKGYTVVHIKTDSIKIADADEDIINFVMEYGKKYGYTFEHEDTYEKICLVNESVYVAKYAKAHVDKKTGKEYWWTATGKQFQVPYLFKTLFSKEEIEFKDLCETKTVSKGRGMYLDMNEDLPADGHNMHFVGKVGEFCPVKEGCGGGILLVERNDKYDAVNGTKGYRWLEAAHVKATGSTDVVDLSYYDKLVNEAIEDISVYGDFEEFAK